ncbi:MAG: site-specific integrase [Erysipelotrichaceae bacterium]|nr:site-specific integrase [Erysipelotrichaceae bacterium]
MMMPEDKLIKRQEKYITERVSKKGTHSLEVCIRMNGQSFRKSVRIDEFPTPGAALAFCVKLRDETITKMRAGKRVTGFPTVRQLYEKSYEILPVSIKTRRRHDIYFRHCFEPYADMPIDKVTAADLQICMNRFAESHTRQETGKMLAVWHRLYKCCGMMDIAVPDRSAAVQIPKGIQPVHRKKDISAEDLETFCAALLSYNAASIKGSYNCQAIYYAIRIMQYTGTRPAETFALMRKDIDLERNTITINKAAHSTENSLLELSNTKTAQSVRTIPIPEGLKPILKECLEWCRHDEMLLTSYDDQLFEISWVDTLIGHVRQKCGVYFTLYQLRHAFSSDLFALGTPAPVIRDLMGHQSESMSLDYALSDESDRIQAINSRKITAKKA